MLAESIEKWLGIADKRNIAVDNPITLIVQYNDQDFWLIVSYLEPSNVTVPFNVTWIVADPDSSRYGQALRRVSLLPSLGDRGTWAQILVEEDIADEAQFWDFSNSFQIGEVQLTATGPATQAAKGLFSLNLEPTDPLDPVVVSSDDSRMSDARQPTTHTHPLLPAVELAGSTGINEFSVRVDTDASPVNGQVLVISSIAQDGTVSGKWQTPLAVDVVYDGPTFDSLEINSTAVNETANEGVAVVFSAIAHFSNGTQQGSLPVTWSIISGQDAAQINSSTGVLTSNDVNGNRVVRVKAEWTHTLSNQTRTNTYDLNIVDTTVTAVLTSIEIQGVGNLNEGGNTSSFVVVAHYNDNSQQAVVPVTFTSSNSGAGTLNSTTGVFTSAVNVTSNQLTTLSATYTQGGVTVGTTHDVTVIDTTIYPVSATIVGASTVPENTTSTFVLSVLFTDGSTSQVSVSNWAISNPAAGTINASSGVLTAPTNLNATESAILSASYTSNGVTKTATKNIQVIDSTVYPVSAVVVGSNNVNEGANSTYQLSVTFSNSTTQVVAVSNWTSSTPSVGVIGSTTGVFTAAADLPANATTDVSASYTANGQTVGGTKVVTVVDTTIYPTSLTILGNATMAENTSQTFTAQVTYANSTTAIVSITDWARSNSAAGAIVANTGVFTAATNVLTGTATNITCSYTEHGQTVNATKAITVQDVTSYPVSATILGLSTVSEGTATTYQMRVTYDNASNAIVSVTDWAVSDPAAGAITTTGQFTAASSVGANIPANITASYSLDGHTVNATLPITVTDSTIYPVSATIIGPSSVVENTTQTYTLRVDFSNATNSIVTVSDWASTVLATGTIGSSTGVFSALEQTGTANTEISASYTNNGQTVSATKALTVTDATNYPVSAIITGPANVNENTTASYVFHVTYTDGSSADEAITNWASTNSAAGVINATTGSFQAAAALTANQATTLSGSFTKFGQTVNATKAITARDVTAYPVSATVVGSASVNEGATTTYTLNVTFTDTTSSNVVVSDWASSNPVAGTIDPVTGVFTAAANVTGSALTTNITATHTVDGVTRTGTKTISVVDTTIYPVSAAITGSATVAEGANSSYVFTVTYSNASTAVRSPTDWGNTNSAAGAIVATTGVFTASDTIIGNKNTVISASWTENGQTVSNTFNITVNDTKIRPVSAVVVGASTLLETAANTQFQLNVTFDDGSSSNVAVTNWSSSNAGAGTINATTGLFTPANIVSDQVTTIGASYTIYGATVSANKALTVTYVRRPVSAAIVGASSLGEGTGTSTYSLSVTFDDGSVATNVATNTWANSNASAGSIVAASGVFTPATNVTSQQATNITASYTEAGATVNANKAVTIGNTINRVTSATILGVATLAEAGNTTTFQFRANYEDGSNQIVSVSNWASSNALAGTINATSGVFTSATVNADEATTITASYTENGFTVNGTKAFTVTDTVVVNTAKARYGVGQFNNYPTFTGGVGQNLAGTAYQSWTGVQDFITSVLTTTVSGAGPYPINLNIPFEPAPMYGYFAHPAFMGEAVFIDSVNGFPGAWDGVQWPDGDVGSTSGSVTVTYNDGTGPTTWKIYRTDFSGIDNYTGTVTVS